MNLFAPRRASDPERVAQIKQWARDAFAVPDDSTVMVTELQCAEPGCPPLETVIAIMDGAGSPPRQFKLHAALTEVTPAALTALAAKPGAAPGHPGAAVGA